MLLRGHIWCRCWHRETLPKGANIVQVFKLLLYTLTASGQLQMSHESNATRVASTHCRQCRKSLFFPSAKWSLTKASNLFTVQSVARDTSLIVFSSWSPGRVFQEKGSCVVFRIAPHRRLGLRKSTVHQVNLPAGFFTLKACIRCARSWWQPGPRPLVCPHQSSFSSEALQQQEVQRRGFRQLMLWHTATYWLFHRQRKRGVKKKKNTILQPCQPQHVVSPF